MMTKTVHGSPCPGENHVINSPNHPPVLGIALRTDPKVYLTDVQLYL